MKQKGQTLRDFQNQKMKTQFFGQNIQTIEKEIYQLYSFNSSMCLHKIHALKKMANNPLHNGALITAVTNKDTTKQ